MATQIQSGLVATGSIAANEIATSGVTTNDINDGAVTNAKIANDAVTGAKILSSTTITCAGLTVNGTVTVTGAITATGDITAFNPSDKRLKDNITPIEDSLEKVLSISGNTYTWNEKSDKEGNDVGVIAQEIQEVLPEAVVERDDGYLAVNYQKLVPLLIEAIKELSSKIDELENNK